MFVVGLALFLKLIERRRGEVRETVEGTPSQAATPFHTTVSRSFALKILLHNSKFKIKKSIKNIFTLYHDALLKGSKLYLPSKWTTEFLEDDVESVMKKKPILLKY